MLRVTIDIVPFGFEHLKREISVLEIVNTHTRDNNVASYTASNKIDSSIGKPLPPQVNLEEHNREDGAWYLIYKLLHQVYGNK